MCAHASTPVHWFCEKGQERPWARTPCARTHTHVPSRVPCSGTGDPAPHCRERPGEGWDTARAGGGASRRRTLAVTTDGLQATRTPHSPSLSGLRCPGRAGGRQRVPELLASPSVLGAWLPVAGWVELGGGRRAEGGRRPCDSRCRGAGPGPMALCPVAPSPHPGARPSFLPNAGGPCRLGSCACSHGGSRLHASAPGLSRAG
uniref:Uncharacterized protein n=1 Tax=Rousettus aegyptiacus TaxID=9407 RepID=A0A7J8BE52_ROUAE|nr:hypothetical protein HJG63_009770 [Rousettus aegyptiacus]